MGETQDPFGLLCNETEACFDVGGVGGEVDDDVYMKYCSKRVFVSDEEEEEEEEEEEYIEKLALKETGFRSGKNEIDCWKSSERWIESARLDAIKWIFTTQKFFGFWHHTAYLSIIYFDQFLSKRSIDEGKWWAIRLLSVACLSLAAKMEEPRVPPLSKFPVEDYAFAGLVIRRMELQVLSTLDWKMGSVTPFPYLHFFVRKFLGESSLISRRSVSRAVELILDITKDINLVVHRPSVIAAAAVLAASDCELTKNDMELKMGVISSWDFQDKEDVFSCYKLMKEIETGKHHTPKSVISQVLPSTNSSSKDVPENPCTKRKLTFNESDETSPVKKIRS